MNSAPAKSASVPEYALAGASEADAGIEYLPDAVAGDSKPFDGFLRGAWLIIPALFSLIVYEHDRSLLITGLWLSGMLAFGQLLLPLAFDVGHQLLKRCDNLYLGAALGWSLVPGPLIGVVFGTLIPWSKDCGFTPATGGLLGLIAGPCFAAVEGIAIVALFHLAIGIATKTGFMPSTAHHGVPFTSEYRPRSLRGAQDLRNHDLN